MTENGKYPYEYIEDVTLEDGSIVTIRPIRPDDAPRLQEGFKRLSPETIYLRFLEAYKEMTDEQAHQYANVDYHQRMALVGCVQEDGEERLVVVARYALIEGDPGAAEAAIVVRDDYQRRGLGTIAMTQLARYARNHDVDNFYGTILMSNFGIMRFIKRSGLKFERKILEPGTWEVRVWLVERQKQDKQNTPQDQGTSE
jgi:acetyltransferase